MRSLFTALVVLAGLSVPGCSDDTKSLPDGPRRDQQRTDAARADQARSDGPLADAAKPDTATRDAAKPDKAGPDKAKPDAAKPDKAKPDSVSCTDGTKNGTETDVDCGGTCPKCVDGKKCSTGTDCTSKVCTGSVCQVPSCTDGVQNGTETDVNCGGSCPKCAGGPPPRDTAKPDAAKPDAAKPDAAKPEIAKPDTLSCGDGKQNGAETDIDCGGSCPKCAIGKSCGVSADCLNGICAATKCRVPLRCAELHAAQPTLPSGAYALDPDDAGSIAPFTAYCEMTTDGGGWTRVAGVANDVAHVSNDAVNAAGLTTASALGKYSDAVINALKSGTSPAFRLRCRAVVGYFPTGCTFNATADATGACTAQAYVYPPTAYGTKQATQPCVAGVADGDSGASDRLIYGPNCACCSGCDTAGDGWGGSGELWVR